MSKFCGKCDFADTVSMYLENMSVKEFINGTDIYIGDNILPLRIESEKDLVAYYPFIECIGACSKEHRMIRLSSKSFIDEEEQERLKWTLKDCLYVYKKYKRKKKPFEYSEELIKECFYFNHVEDYQLEILKRVCQDGLKANTRGIHTHIHDYYRKQWFDEMIKVGWEIEKAYPWVYGWSRWFEYYKEYKENKYD